MECAAKKKSILNSDSFDFSLKKKKKSSSHTNCRMDTKFVCICTCKTGQLHALLYIYESSLRQFYASVTFISIGP